LRFYTIIALPSITGNKRQKQWDEAPVVIPSECEGSRLHFGCHRNLCEFANPREIPRSEPDRHSLRGSGWRGDCYEIGRIV